LSLIIQRKNEVVAELMEDHIKLKKELGELLRVSNLIDGNSAVSEQAI
jgi:hypothetical protein